MLKMLKVLKMLKHSFENIPVWSTKCIDRIFSIFSIFSNPQARFVGSNHENSEIYGFSAFSAFFGLVSRALRRFARSAPCLACCTAEVLKIIERALGWEERNMFWDFQHIQHFQHFTDMIPWVESWKSCIPASCIVPATAETLDLSWVRCESVHNTSDK